MTTGMIPICTASFTRSARMAVIHATELGSSQFTVEHLFLSLLEVDVGAVTGQLRGCKKSAIDLKALRARAAAKAQEKDDDGFLGLFSVLYIASNLNLFPVVSTVQLALAILLEETNAIHKYLTERGVDVGREAAKRTRLFDLEAYSIQPPVLRSLKKRCCDPVVRLALKTQTSKILEQVVLGEEGPHQPEGRARVWLGDLIPDQSLGYLTKGYLDAKSELYPGRIYRIFAEKRTEIWEEGNLVADACIHTVDSALPPTDGVIAQYFLIRGDERRYLKTANVRTLKSEGGEQHAD